MGGKYRQSRGIVECIRPYVEDGFTYVEPFCGGMWSAARVCMDLHPGRVILNDVNRPLMLLWDRCLEDGVDWLPTDMGEIEANYQYYKHDAPDDDPLKAWYGIACSFGGKWFGGVARSKGKTDFKPQARSTARKADTLRPCHPELSWGSYKEMSIPDGSVVYCDPPVPGQDKGALLRELRLRRVLAVGTQPVHPLHGVHVVLRVPRGLPRGVQVGRHSGQAQSRARVRWHLRADGGVRC